MDDVLRAAALVWVIFGLLILVVLLFGAGDEPD